MANADYVMYSQGGLCPYATLEAAIDEASSTIVVKDFQTVQSPQDDLEVGMAVLIGDEVFRLDSTTLPVLSVSRGCADTIPASHAVDSPVWFFGNAAESDGREHTATSTVAVKLLPFSPSSGHVPMENAPPLNLTFNWRFARPYAPALMLCNGEPWYSVVFNLESSDAFDFTWNHRDRLLQSDQLVGHGEGSIGPEPGTTYTARVYDAEDTLVRTVDGITDGEWSYDRSLAEVDVPEGVGRVEICSVRDSLESWQRYTIYISPAGGGEGGFGLAFGMNFGG